MTVLSYPTQKSEVCCVTWGQEAARRAVAYILKGQQRGEDPTTCIMDPIRKPTQVLLCSRHLLIPSTDPQAPSILMGFHLMAGSLCEQEPMQTASEHVQETCLTLKN